MFIVDDLLAWLVGLVADAGRKKLVTLVLGSDQERALRSAVEAAVAATAVQLAPSGEQADQLAVAVGEVFRGAPKVALAGQRTLLEALQAGIAAQVAVLDDPAATGARRSLLGVPGGLLAQTLAGHLVHEITVRGAQGGPLTPLADQLNHDMTHLQGERLEGMLAQVMSMVTELAQAGHGPQVPRKPVRLALRPVRLAGRKELLVDLDAKLTSDGDTGPRIVALCGLGGAGKTSVALEYAHRHLAEVGVAWQLPAEDATVLAAGFGELAAQLGALDMLDVRDPVASVHGVLAASPAQWLLVFDNAPDCASVAAFVPPAGRGRVLITSRNQIWPPGQALEVPVLNPEVAAGFLVSRTGDADGQAAPELARELGGLPLALEQAAAYVQATGENLADYLALFRQQRVGMLSRGEPTGYSETVATTWRLAFERLQQAEPGAVGLLRLLAFCAPEAIPLRLLHPSPGLGDELGPGIAPVLIPLLEDPLAAKDAIVALRRHSLISPPADGSVSVHRLVQAITIAQMPAELAAAWQQAAAAVIEAALPADPESPDTWDAFAKLLPHAQAALADDSGSMWKIVSYLGNSGNYPAARDLQHRLLQAQVRVSGPEHPDTLAARGELAYWTGQAGNAAGARDQVAALLPVRERVSGPEHPDTLADRANLARFTGDAGDAAGARDLYAALLPVRERVLGPEDPRTLRARHGLARWTGEAGDAAGARDQFTVLLPARERVSGPEHPDTLTARGDLVYWTGQAGDAAGARDQFAALLPVRERVLGPEHPDTLADRHELARWTGEAGDAAGARNQLAALLPARERVSGPEHPDTLTTRRHLAHWTAMAGDAAAARDQLAALLPIEERVLGDEHPQTLADRGGLAIWTGAAGDAAGARDQLAVLLPVRERVSGTEHPQTLSDLFNLAWWTGAAGDAAGARDQYAVLLPTQKRVMGDEHPYTLATRARLAYWTGAAGDAAGARDQYAALLPILKRVLGDEHPETLVDRSNLANWTGEAGNPAGARDQLAALMPARERVSGAEHPDTLTDHARLARWTGAAGDAAGARDQYAALLPVMDRVLGTGHPETQAARETPAKWADEADDDVSHG